MSLKSSCIALAARLHRVCRLGANICGRLVGQWGERELHGCLDVLVHDDVSAVFRFDVPGSAKGFGDGSGSLLFRSQPITEWQIRTRPLTLARQSARDL